MVISHNPEVTIEVVTSLYYGPQRASKLVEMVKENLKVSEPTVYSVLQDLVERALVEKDVHSRRNISYRLTDAGRRLIEKEHFDAIGDILTVIKSSKRKREILVELLLDDILASLPPDFSTGEGKAALRASMDEEVENLKRRLTMLSKAATQKGG